MRGRYPQWKVDLFRTRERPAVCTCRTEEDGTPLLRATCKLHGWVGDADAEEGRSIVENDAIQAEGHAAPLGDKESPLDA